MLKLKLQCFGHLIVKSRLIGKDPELLRKIEGRRRRWWQRMRWLYSITSSTDVNLNKFCEIVDRKAWHAAVHGVTKSPLFKISAQFLFLLLIQYSCLKNLAIITCPY